MTDIIQVLPDSVANQIAAGEVIQRPASVVKELVENAIDAGAIDIQVIIKDGGKTIIQVIDDGCGMTETDARMAFERHATSKISGANDLFSIKSMGFRGEALASIAAIAEVEVKTKIHNHEIGTFLSVSGSQVTKQEPISTQSGTNILVKNLFYNVPARRKFLKTNATEFRHIMLQFQRVALAYPEIGFSLIHNKSEILRLHKVTLRKRISHIFGKSIDQQLLPLYNETDLATISGFIGNPDAAKKTSGNQYFFVNNRFIKHSYFHKAVMKGYERILSPQYYPFYILFLNVDPETIDINIHPTKTEVKFEDERALFQILHAAVKRTLGKYNIVPSLEFDDEGSVDIPPPPNSGAEVKIPEVEVNPDFNPFSQTKDQIKKPPAGWEQLYHAFENDVPESKNTESPENTMASSGIEPKEAEGMNNNLIQVKYKYIFTPVKSGVMIIDQKRAHERILFEKFLHAQQQEQGFAQHSLFPQTVSLDPMYYNILTEIQDDLNQMGFDIRAFGENTIVIQAVPADFSHFDPEETLLNALQEYQDTQQMNFGAARERIALSMAKTYSIDYGRELTNQEMRELIDQLFACEVPNYAPDGNPVISIIAMDEIEKRMTKPN